MNQDLSVIAVPQGEVGEILTSNEDGIPEWGKLEMAKFYFFEYIVWVLVNLKICYPITITYIDSCGDVISYTAYTTHKI